MAVATLPDQTVPIPVFERRIAANGAAYHECGKGEPLVLIHGVGMRLEAWAPQIEVFGATHRVIAVDMPGHGQSAPLPPGSDLVAFVAWFGAFLDVLSLDRVNVAGHSMGALVSGGAVAVFPERIRRVALLNGVFCRDTAAKKAVLARAASIEAHGIDVDGPVQRWFDDGEASRKPRALTRAWLSGMDRQAYATAYGAFAGGDATYAHEWAGVKCPALFLTGSGDPNSTPDMARQMAALTPRGVARIIQGHRHMVNLTAAEAVNALLREWLATPEPAS
ncbi:alpha/beta fold hydrolase [Rhizobiaceae bacterium BDR2-2]|uniref:Alpha/beta fold hydrolase n=1 Tax=Ectorhizobium quercum TaxID=2965071 RepID=A0AAE3MZ78_9HYPH|nr:alpha/beta fold hydrolase [Ectorhizobium quercum]MCX8997181.1 alpha/beta fold hydrolase [Ectorhizobium quercum]